MTIVSLLEVFFMLLKHNNIAIVTRIKHKIFFIRWTRLSSSQPLHQTGVKALSIKLQIKLLNFIKFELDQDTISRPNGSEKMFYVKFLYQQH